MPSLAGQTPASTFGDLVNFDNGGSGASGTLRALRDGLGVSLPVQISTGGVNFTGTLTLSGVNLVTSARSIASANSITGGGDLSADRTLQLSGDSASPGNTKVYGTNGSGTKGWQDLQTIVDAAVSAALGSPAIDYLNFLPAITGLTGGGATNLDGIVTAGDAVAVLAVRLIYLSATGLFAYQLRASSDAESSPEKIRPDDYNAVSNTRVWFRVL